MRAPTAMATLASITAITAIAALGCGAPRPVNLQEGPREYVAADYDALLQRWTRAGRLYSFQGIDDVLSVSTTFEAWEFRWAYVVRYADDYRLTIDQRRELLANALEDARRHHQFYVALYGNRPRESDLTAPQPAWVVRMVDDQGHVTAPEDIIPIKKPGVLEKTYFPYTSPWRTIFRVRFPAFTSGGPTIGAGAKVVTLRFSGPLGTLELPWTLAR